MVTKLIFIGKPEVGKTTIKKVIFEGIDPNALILFPLEPTIGTSFSVHDFMDLKISLVDTPGQSLPIILEDEEKQANLFVNTSAIVYIFDYLMWISQSNDIVNDIKKIYEINKKSNYKANIFLFFHKIDLISKNMRNNLDVFESQILSELNIQESIPIYFTSLHPNLIYTIYNALTDIIGSFLLDITNLRNFLNKLISTLSKTICFVTNKNNCIIVRTMTNNFDKSLIYDLTEKLNQISINFKEKTKIEEKIEIIESGSKILSYIIKDLKNVYSQFNKIILFSEIQDNKILFEILEKLELEYGKSP
ncbi:MAG TPA: GTPase [Candidatus Lokiarchaeia archaeon]